MRKEVVDHHCLVSMVSVKTHVGRETEITTGVPGEGQAGLSRTTWNLAGERMWKAMSTRRRLSDWRGDA